MYIHIYIYIYTYIYTHTCIYVDTHSYSSWWRQLSESSEYPAPGWGLSHPVVKRAIKVIIERDILYSNMKDYTILYYTILSPDNHTYIYIYIYICILWSTVYLSKYISLYI